MNNEFSAADIAVGYGSNFLKMVGVRSLICFLFMCCANDQDHRSVRTRRALHGTCLHCGLNQAVQSQDP